MKITPSYVADSLLRSHLLGLPQRKRLRSDGKLHRPLLRGSRTDDGYRLRPSGEQLKYCSEALDFFKEKLRTPARIAQEFHRLQEMRPTMDEIVRKCSVALRDANLDKNRYTDILPFDNNRIVLNSTRDSTPLRNNYINASLIGLASGEKVSQFIATQGPLPETFEDFWEMVFEYRCPAIVMLTRVDNHRLVKPALSVLHIQYPEWPDHGVPEDTASVREIFEMTHHLPPEIGPIVVHCR
ncbi:unnamed protein product, partial [Musa textilis]